MIWETWEIFISALQSILANKIRSFLTIIGIVIGIASVIAISSLGEGSKKSVSENLKKLGTNRISIGVNYRGGLTDRDRFNYQDEETLRNYSEITEVSPESNMNARYEMQNDYYEVSLHGVKEEYNKIQLIEMIHGSFITTEDLKSAAKVIVIDDVFAKMLFNKEDVLGEHIKLHVGKSFHTFVVSGVYKNTSGSVDSMFSKNFRENAYIPITVTERINPRFFIQQYQANIKDIKKLEEVSADITKILELKHHNVNKYFVQSAMSRMESVTSVLDTLTIFISFVAGISLFVGGIGVMNIMLVSVTERTKEIGICKSIGASNYVILMQFLLEAVILCLTGGLLGIAMGIGLGNVLGGVINTKPYVSLNSVLIAFSISTAIGIVFGVYPARKASKLNPIDALRYE